jgi:CRISPR-associated protein Cas2
MPATAPKDEAPLFAVCYDITDDRERRRVAKLLEAYGFRVQKSVFECHLGHAQKQQLATALERLRLRTGQVRTYRIYAGSPVATAGRETPHPDAVFAYCI